MMQDPDSQIPGRDPILGPFEDMSPEAGRRKDRISSIFLSTKVALHVSLSAKVIEKMQRDLADPKVRWLIIGDPDPETVRWIAVDQIVEIKFVPDGT